jgi:O-antigen/teichoic acid export membrane protein
MLMNTLAVFISLLIFLWLTRKTWEVAITAKINWIKLKKMLTFSLPLVAGGIAYWGLTTIDRFFLRHYVGFDELGVYALSVTLAGAVFVASSIFSNLWHPILYQGVKNGIDEKKVQRVIENMTLFVSLVWSIIGSLTFVAPYFFPPVYASIEYLIVACVAMPLFYMLAETTGVGIGIKRRSIYGMAASIVALIVNILLNFVLIPSYGTAGAALATLISFFIFFTVKTEASSVLWCSLPRIKIYLILLLYMLATSIMVIYQAEVHYFNFVWLLLLLLTCVLFYSRVSENVQYLYKQLINRS